MRGIVTSVKAHPFVPMNTIVFMLDLSHPETRIEDYPDGIIVVIPTGMPLLYDECLHLVGRPIDTERI